MNYKSFYFPILALFLYGCSSSEVPIDQLTYKNGLKVLKDSGEPFTGMSIRFEGKDTPAEIIEYKNGKLDGIIQRWYPNGTLKEEFNARLNDKFYIVAQAYEMGSRNRETNELDKVALKSFLIRYGEEHKWYQNGKLVSEGEYSKDGSRKVGAWRKWYKNGELEEEGSYNSLPITEDSNLRRKDNVEGVKIGQWNRWYENGELNTEEFYNNEGLQNRIWKTYCKNGMVGKETEFKVGTIVGTKKYWACDGKELDQINYVDGKKDGSFTTFVTKNRTALDTLINTVDYGGKVEYDVNSEDYFKAIQGFFVNGEKSGLWTTWDKTGKITSNTDYSKDNFLNSEYSKPFLKKGKFGPYASRYSNWRINHFNFKDAKANIEETQLYLKRNLVNPAKKIITKGKIRQGRNNSGISHWTYPIIVAPEALYDVIKTHPGVTVDAIDTNGRNRLHLCTILMLGKKPGRCSFEHFISLVKDIPVNSADYDGMTAMNYVADSYDSRHRASATEDVAIDVIKALAQAGADINHQNAKGQTTLMRALSHKKYKIAKTLLDLGANVNAKDSESHNAIHFVFFQATKYSYNYSFNLDESRKEILTLLVQKGARIDLPDLKEKTVKDVALKQGAIKAVLFLETLSKLTLDEKPLEPVEKTVEKDIQDKQVIQDTNIKIEKSDSSSLDQVKTAVDTATNLSADEMTEKSESIRTEEDSVNQEDQLYQKALSQIKRNRLSKPKGDSALDSLNILSALSSEKDSRVIELRQKIANKYLSLARGRINDYRYQDARKFIKVSQNIQTSNTATQLMAKVNQRIKEEREAQQLQLLQQQQLEQQTNSKNQPKPVQQKKNKVGFGEMFKSIFD